MIVDSSAIVAIVAGEGSGPRYAEAIIGATSATISAANFLEVAIVIDRRDDPVIRARFDEVIAQLALVIAPVTVEQALLARQAHRDYGRGSGHRAGLNFGDCFAYALAKASSEPLLYQGDDFAHTDIRSALAI
ncbi:MAG TPA: type II toxin-antitoxin system VapC family toxin [Pseudolysinimonas sp.]|nr:type II toxin-antitoxin system VapC family toxin [Pseudolysinimonas sp.]